MQCNPYNNTAPGASSSAWGCKYYEQPQDWPAVCGATAVEGHNNVARSVLSEELRVMDGEAREEREAVEAEFEAKATAMRRQSSTGAELMEGHNNVARSVLSEELRVMNDEAREEREARVSCTRRDGKKREEACGMKTTGDWSERMGVVLQRANRWINAVTRW